MLDRRDFLKLSAAAAATGALAACHSQPEPPVDPARFAHAARSRTAILPHATYDDDLTETVLRGLRLCGVAAAGRRVLLKPNMVEFDPHSAINTHPALVAAAAEAFRKLGAREVLVGEGPGHRRDNEYMLNASGLAYSLHSIGCSYVDLNTDNLRSHALRSSFTDLQSLYLPVSVLESDLIVSMPKLKTHKWAGVTLSMKNMFGIVPGAVYGWPKNVLHWAGIDGSILDVNAALPTPRFNIVDGIVGMEGNGPIQGEARQSGIVLLGEDPIAVDATAARLMGLEPSRISHLLQGSTFLGNLEEDRIEQLAEGIDAFRQPYRLLDRFAHLAA